MTAVWWFAAAAVLALVGLALTLAARRRTVRGPERAVETRTHPGEGDDTAPPHEDMFSPIVESTPAEVARYWREREGQP